MANVTQRHHRELGREKSDESIEAKLGAKVTIDRSGCWIVGDDPTKYTNIVLRGAGPGATVRAHRYVYDLMVGEIPDGHHIHHTCEIPACINPAHLEALSPLDHKRAHKILREAN
jgi:hypothetical protein